MNESIEILLFIRLNAIAVTDPNLESKIVERISV